MTRVALDARRLQDDPLTGVGRSLANLLPHLAEAVDLVLLTDARRPSDGLGDYEVARLSCPDHMPEPYWLQLSAARWLRGFDGVFHGTYNAVPFGLRGPSVVTIYDLSWEHHPEDLSWSRKFSFRTQARWSARHAGAVITGSEFIRAQLIETYRLAPQRVLLAPNAVDPIFSPDRRGDVPPLLRRLGVDRDYVVALGGAKRRGLEVAVQAWQRLSLAARRPMLVVVGPEAPPVAPGIVHAGRLTDPDWSALLAGAAAFCYPTRYEGFGMPALEAAASGTPVVCARVGPLPEVLGDAAEWCATPSVIDISQALNRLLQDDGRRETLRRAGLKRAAGAFSWTESAKVVAEAYRMADL